MAAVPAAGKTNRIIMGTIRVGIDVGGTFTDFTVLDDETGAMRHFKVSSTPHDPSEAIETGIASFPERGLSAADVVHFGHGTTVATNMVIERRGGKTGLLTTAGFRDVLEIGRQTRPDLFDMSVRKPDPLVVRPLRLEVSERLGPDGEMILPLDEEGVAAAARHFREAEVEAIAIGFLHSYRNPAHEQRAAAIIRDYLPDVFISLSSDVLPEFREYERISTTVMNAYLMPRMDGYLDRFMKRSRKTGVEAKPYTIHSNGGLMSTETARNYPVRTCLSGPAAGVVGAALVGKAASFPDIITYDVGGTSTDVALIAGGKPAYSADRDVAGYSIRCPMVDVSVIGAGGGSIAWLDDAGGLKVGPQSAAAVPGPAAYGKGGTEATITDANIVLQRLNPVALLDGAMPVDREAALKAVGAVAEKIGRSVEDTAWGIIRIAVANMARAIRAVSMDKGHDLKQFALMAFGGAGPLHASLVAAETGLETVIIPESPGTMCARGVLLSDVTRDFVSTQIKRAEGESWKEITAAVVALEEQASAWLEAETIPDDKRALQHIAEARYAGQNHEIRVEGVLTTAQDFAARFAGAHKVVYGYALDDHPVEIVNLRVQAIGHAGRPLQTVASAPGSMAAARMGERDVYVGPERGWLTMPVYKRALMPQGEEFSGPAIIEELTSTAYVLPDQQGVVDAYGNIILKFVKGRA
ncbi:MULTISPECIES: hydantoinase/oxoprolinase family protein [unclassified Chelatococcus]|uniref:hydantoinase/oxoprolinase family protein n=1 Tax=unclassified Chelatococcus TaxID=2638111 RepID=UPI00224BD535|nr:hydantoinase/oxoprolinase family protein [Chelatococcus sp.]MCO5074464.1 hydantoinase/oxoprolinase family protein [Chelatococcus sp.]CAH1650947.1 N-methylhydantoinase A [Hyphomicrobiales bacterium]CAH1692948.1 N-methylhydantoinase A [Hyphomicrobiales bacterium]